MRNQMTLLLVLAFVLLFASVPGLLVGMWLAAKVGSFLLFPVPSAALVALAAVCMARVERSL